jgi:hypothetical protein
MAALRRGPTLSPRSLVARGPGFERFIESHTDCEYAYYRSGKWAFRDALDLAMAARNGSEVILPAYVPGGFVEPIREAGLTPRFHRVRPDLRPDLGHVRSLVDGETLAVVSIGYFGRPQPPEVSEELRSLCDASEAVLVDDAAHGAFSVGKTGLAGTAGHLGFASLHKSLPTPDGAVLYVGDESLRGSYRRSTVASRPTPADIRYLANTSLRSVRRSGSPIHRTRDGERSMQSPADLDPEALYLQAKGEMSWLTARVAKQVDPIAIRRRRWENYAVWERMLTNQPDLDTVYSSIDTATCPLYYPVVLTDLTKSITMLGRSWPPLPHEVKRSDQFELSNHFATHLYTFPVHQQLTPEKIKVAIDGRPED